MDARPIVYLCDRRAFVEPTPGIWVCVGDQNAFEDLGEAERWALVIAAYARYGVTPPGITVH